MNTLQVLEEGLGHGLAGGAVPIFRQLPDQFTGQDFGVLENQRLALAEQWYQHLAKDGRTTVEQRQHQVQRTGQRHRVQTRDRARLFNTMD
jgi:hypothetical protein